MVGVAGGKNLASGDFSLEFDLATAAPAKTGKITSATPLTAKAGGTASTTGKIDGGTEIDLAWAANSSVACFPATANNHFNGKHVVVTGGSRGLGLVLARQLVDAGARVSICSRDGNELARAFDELTERGGRVAAIECDVADPARVREFFAVAGSPLTTGRVLHSWRS